MDASQYKEYVLFMLFIKYVTDKYGNSTDFAPPVTIPTGVIRFVFSNSAILVRRRRQQTDRSCAAAKAYHLAAKSQLARDSGTSE